MSRSTPAERIAALEAKVVKRSPARSNLSPIKHVNRDFFTCDLLDYALKDDGASMEAPIFSLSTKADTSIWNWQSKDGKKSLTVTPSVLGRATQHDKDVLIYIISQLTAGLNKKVDSAGSRVVRFVVHNYLASTNRSAGGKEYDRFLDALERLQGTAIKTDIQTGGKRIKEGFGLIERWKIIEKSPKNSRMVAVEVVLSEWLYNAVQAHEVLTLDEDYFRLRKPLARRLYELARKHCGGQNSWTIGLELLLDKSGSRSSLAEFKRMVKSIIEADDLPRYRMSLNEMSHQVRFYQKDVRAFVMRTTVPLPLESGKK